MASRQFFLFSCILLAFPFSSKANENLVELVKKTKPAVVLIQTFDANNQPIGQGSGFFVNNKGHIVTNHHVLEGAYRATVKTSSGMEYPVEGIIAKNTDADIVKLVVNIPDANITFLNLSANVPSEGEDIVVIGNPLGLESSVSTGIVSAVRDIPAFGKILQITAPISPGSSGSPVINSKGEVIGIATLIITSGQNLNFAITSDKIIALKETAKTPIFDALTADSNDAQLFYQKGLKELWQENWSAALTYFQKAKEVNPQDAEVWFYLGVVYGKLGRYQDVIEACKQAIRIKLDLVEAHYNLGVTYDKLGRYQDAIESYKQAIRIKPDYANAHYNLGVFYFKLGRYQDEIEAYKQAIRIKPDFADAHNNLGVAYENLGCYQEEIEVCKQAIRIKPDFADAHYNLGVAYGKLGRYQDSIEACKQAIRIKPDFAEAHYNLGVSYLNLGRYQDAIEAFKQAIRIKPDYAEAHYNLGVAYFATGDKGSALEEYKILKSLDTEQANKLFNLIYK
jgi:tetratricopeptide (TPR) repeat protein